MNARPSPRAKPETLLQILTRIVGGWDTEAGRMLARVWALEYRIAEETGRKQPADMHIVCNAFEARESELRKELTALAKVAGAR